MTTGLKLRPDLLKSAAGHAAFAWLMRKSRLIAPPIVW
jgi:hypothetical protein